MIDSPRVCIQVQSIYVESQSILKKSVMSSLIPSLSVIWGGTTCNCWAVTG